MGRTRARPPGKHRLLAYTRVSTKTQAETGHSLGAQLEYIGHYIKARETLELVNTFVDEGYSGGLPFRKRPELRKAIAILNAGEADGLIFLKLDRLTRNLADLSRIVSMAKKNHWHLLSINESIDTTTPMGVFQLNIMGAVAELERGQISERVKTAFGSMIPKMYAVSRIAPFGYQFENGALCISKEMARARKKKQPWILVPNKAEQAALATILLCLRNRRVPASMHKIAARLNKLGLRARNGDIFTATRVNSIVSTHYRRQIHLDKLQQQQQQSEKAS